MVKNRNDESLQLNLRIARFLGSNTQEEAPSAQADVDSALIGLQDILATMGIHHATILAGGIAPKSHEMDNIQGVDSDARTFRGLGESLESMNPEKERIGQLKSNLGRAGYRIGEPPVIYKRSRDVYAPEPLPSPETRHTNIEFPEKVEVGKWEKLKIQIVDPFIRDSRGQIIAANDLEKGEDELVVANLDNGPQELYFRVKVRGGIVQNNETRRILVPPTGNSAVVEVSVLTQAEGDLELTIKFMQNFRPIGTVVRNARAVLEVEDKNQPPRLTKTNLGPGDRGPDLLIEIDYQKLANGNMEYDFILSSPPDIFNLIGETIGTTVLHDDPEEWVSQQNLAIAEARKYNSERELNDLIVSFGQTIFEDLFPPALEKILLENQGLKTIVFNSEETIIPWEVAYFFPDNKNNSLGNFLCDKFQVSRWVGNHSMPSALVFDQALLVAVRSSIGTPDLNQSNKKNLIFNGLGPAEVPVVEVDPSYEEMVGYFSNPEIGLFHFECHGDFQDGGDLSTLYLRDGKLRAQFLGNPGYVLDTSRPMIFLDACQTGQGGSSLAGPGGWAIEAMSAGASAFISPIWEVRADIAELFAGRFYEELGKGATFGEAVAAAREYARQEDDSFTWLSYSVYGDPNARLE